MCSLISTLTMTSDRDYHRQWTQTARSNPDYVHHQNLLRRTRYEQQNAWRRQLTGEHQLASSTITVSLQFNHSHFISHVIFIFRCFT